MARSRKDKPGTAADTPTTKRRASRDKMQQVPWREDPLILQRLEKVAEMKARNMTHTAIADVLNVNLDTVTADAKRLQELWRERVDQTVVDLRAQQVAKLDYLYTLAVEGYQEDRTMTRAVLTDDPVEVRMCPGNVMHYSTGLLGELEEAMDRQRRERPPGEEWPQLGEDETDSQDRRTFRRLRQARCTAPHEIEVRVWRDAKGGIVWRSNAPSFLTVAKAALQEQNRIMGLQPEKGAGENDPTGLLTFLDEVLEWEGKRDKDQEAKALAAANTVDGEYTEVDQ